MTEEKPKVLHTELKGNLLTRFNIIKSVLGIQHDAEVVRFLIQNYYKGYLESEKIAAREEIERDREIVKQFMKKYGEEWRKLGED